MIHYDLRCRAAHQFDAWFRDSAAFDEQAAAGLLECPVCGEHEVSRAMMAPAVPRKRRPAAPAVRPAPAATPPTTVTPQHMPAHLRAALQRIRAEVERNCDYVGERFAAEARRIHDGDAKARGIYGEATPEQAQALADDGIEVGQVPWLPRSDA